MNIIVDTSVWSLALRRNAISNQREVIFLQSLIDDPKEKLWLLGVVMLELLQGVPSVSQFNKLKESLFRYPFLEPTRDEYIFASEIINYCLSKGITTKSIDALIASVTIKRDYFLLTADKDFQHIAKHFPLKLI